MRPGSPIWDQGPARSCRRANPWRARKSPCPLATCVQQAVLAVASCGSHRYRGCPPATVDLRDTFPPLPSARCLRASLSITWDATPVARCARRSAEIAGVSSSSRPDWRVKYRACRMSRPPVLKSHGWRLVSDQLWMVRATPAGAEDCRGYRRSLPRVAGPRWPESDDRRAESSGSRSPPP